MQKTKTFIFIILATLILAGCQQISDKAGEIGNEAQKQAESIMTQVDATKTQILDTRAKFDEKVQQAQDAAAAVPKLAQ